MVRTKEHIPARFPWPFQGRSLSFPGDADVVGKIEPCNNSSEDYFTDSFHTTLCNNRKNCHWFAATFDTMAYDTKNSAASTHRQFVVRDCHMMLSFPSKAHADLDKILDYPMSKRLLATKFDNLQIKVDWSTFFLIPMQNCTMLSGFYCDGILAYDAHQQVRQVEKSALHIFILELAILFARLLPATVLLEVLQWLPLCNRVGRHRTVNLCQSVSNSIAAIRSAGTHCVCQ